MKLWSRVIALALLCLSTGASDAQQVGFAVSETLEAGEMQLPYTLNVELTAAEPTRVGVNAVLDLREIQKLVPERLAENALIDNCSLQVKLDDLSIVAENDAIAVDSLLAVTRFDCGRIDENNFRRGEQKSTFAAKLSTVASVELRDNCAYLKIPDVTLGSPEATREQLLREETLAEVRSFLLAAIDLVLSETPLCPELPEELSSIDPRYYKGGPREIEDGGLGVILSGSLDVSPSTIIDMLLVLQQEEVIPGPP